MQKSSLTTNKLEKQRAKGKEKKTATIHCHSTCGRADQRHGCEAHSSNRSSSSCEGTNCQYSCTHTSSHQRPVWVIRV